MIINRQAKESNWGVKNMVNQRLTKRVLVALTAITGLFTSLINAAEINNIDFSVLPGIKTSRYCVSGVAPW